MMKHPRMLKWSVNNIPEMVEREMVEVEQGDLLRKEQEQVYRRKKSLKWKKLKYVMKFCQLGRKKEVIKPVRSY